MLELHGFHNSNIVVQICLPAVTPAWQESKLRRTRRVLYYHKYVHL